nr:hypothetical protein [Micromonospora sp. DSM 115978]
MSLVDIRVEIARGADRTADPETWVWTDVSARWRKGGQPIGIAQGAAPEFAQAPPATCEVVLDNRDGALTRRNALSPWYGTLLDYTPLRVSVNAGSGWLVRYVGEITEWPRVGHLSGNDVTAVLRAAGVTRRLAQDEQALRSAPYRWLPTANPVAAWAMEDAPGVPTGAPLVGSSTLRPFRGRHPSGPLVITWPQWGAGTLASWLPPVLARSGTDELTIIYGDVVMGSTTEWTVDLMCASGQDAGATTIDINPSYILGADAGGLSSWPQLILTPGSAVDVAMNGEPEVQADYTPLYDGSAHHIRWTAYQDGAAVSWTVWIDGVEVNTGTTAGSMTLPRVIRIGLAAEAQSGTGVAQGYLAVWAEWPPALQDAVAAAHGWRRERAGRRIERLCDEQRIRLQVPSPYRVVDDFDRTETAEWGDATTGETWTTDGGSAGDYDVAAGQGLIEQPSATVLRTVVLTDARQGDEFDVRVLVEVPAVATGGSVGMHAGIVARWADDATHIRAQLRFTPGGNAVTLGWVEPGGAGLAIGLAPSVAVSYQAGDRWWLRAAGSGSSFRARAWLEGTPEPWDWQARGTSTAHLAGRVGVFARRGVGDTTSGATFIYESFSSRSVLDETEPTAAQGVDTLGRLLRQAEQAEQGRLQDAPTAIELQFVPRSAPYNMPYALDLQVSSGDLGDVPDLQDDDLRRYNRVTATMPSGTQYVAQDDAAVAAAGGLTLDSPISPPVASDIQVPHHAGWHLAQGTVDEDRVPGLPLNFARRPDLIDDFASVIPGASRVRAVGGTLLGSAPADQIIEGWTESIRPEVWTATLNCTPATPWTVGVVEDPELGRVDTDGSVLVDAVDAGTDTSMLVEVTAGPHWITTATHPAMLPLEVRSAGVVLEVTGIAAAVSDQFGRSVSNGWGSADTGQAWTATGGSAANFSVGSGVGAQANSTVNDLRRCKVDTGATEVDFIADVSLSIGSALTQPATTWIAGRLADDSNYYAAALSLSTAGVMSIRLDKRVAGSLSTVTAARTLGANSANDVWRVWLKIVGGYIRAKCWNLTTSQPEPRGWTILGSDTDLTAGTQLGLMSRLESGNTNTTPVTWSWDSLTIQNRQVFTITAAPVNGVVKTIPAGSPVSLAHPWRLAL